MERRGGRKGHGGKPPATPSLAAYEEELAVVGWSCQLFHDDDAAEFVQQGRGLVPWMGSDTLLVDRYDVRHLLSELPVKRKRHAAADAAEAELDAERYGDLWAAKQEEQRQQVQEEEQDAFQQYYAEQEAAQESAADVRTASGYQNVPYSYNDEQIEQEAPAAPAPGRPASAEPYVPPFELPEHLQGLGVRPATMKHHKVIVGTADFVRSHPPSRAGQVEVLLRVKQGSNPMFAFLTPGDPLHPYYQYILKHNPQPPKPQPPAVSSLALVSMAYNEEEPDDEQCAREAETGPLPRSHAQVTIQAKMAVPAAHDEEPAPPGVTPVVPGSAHPSAPPPDIKQVIDKMVEYVRKNGLEFEISIKVREKMNPKFAFLLPWNQWNPYYVAVAAKSVGVSGGDSQPYMASTQRPVTLAQHPKPPGQFSAVTRTPTIEVTPSEQARSTRADDTGNAREPAVPPAQTDSCVARAAAAAAAISQKIKQEERVRRVRALLSRAAGSENITSPTGLEAAERLVSDVSISHSSDKDADEPLVSAEGSQRIAASTAQASPVLEEAKEPKEAAVIEKRERRHHRHRHRSRSPDRSPEHHSSKKTRHRGSGSSGDPDGDERRRERHRSHQHGDRHERRHISGKRHRKHGHVRHSTR
eukprot:jgi/Chlat1/7802/Chrsp66S07252